jgi:hypothetical protein
MELDYKTIIGYEKVLTVFGKWPSFHDAEVISLALERDVGEECTAPRMTVTLHAFRLEVSPDDPSRNDSLVSLQFRAVEKLKLADFNHQNAINGITISTQWSDQLQRQVLQVKFLQGFGLSCEFQSEEIEVMLVQPYQPRWGAWKKDE